MKLSAINENCDQSDEKNPNTKKNNLPFLREKYTNILLKSKTGNKTDIFNEYDDLLNSIENELLINTLSGADANALRRIQTGCLKQLGKLADSSKKCLYFSQAVDLEPHDVSLLVDYSIALFNTDYIYLAMASFKKVLNYNISHSISYQYLILINSIFGNYDQCIQYCTDILNFSQNYFFATTIFFCVEKVCPFADYKIKINDLATSHKIKFKSSALNERIKNWFLFQYNLWRNKQFNVAIDFAPRCDISDFTSKLTYLNLSSFFKCINGFLEKYLGITSIPIDLHKNYKNSNKKHKSKISDVSSQTHVNKRSEKVPHTDLTEHVNESLSSIVKQLRLKKFKLNYNNFSQVEEPTLNNTETIEVAHSNFFNDLCSSLCRVKTLDCFIISLVKSMAMSLPTHHWDLEICSFYLHLFSNVQGKYFNHMKNDLDVILSFLRFIEIYKILLDENRFINQDIKQKYQFTIFNSLHRIRHLFFLEPLKDVPSEIVVRILFSLGLSSENKQSAVFYYSLCLESLGDLVIFLFAENYIKDISIVSKNSLNRLITRCENSAIFKHTQKLFKHKKFKKIYREYRVNFKNDHSLLTCLDVLSLKLYIKKLLNAFLSMEDYSCDIVDDLLCILTFINWTHKNKINSFTLDSLNDTILLCMEKLMTDLKFHNEKIYVRLFLFFVECVKLPTYSDTPILCMKLWDFLTTLVFHFTQNRKPRFAFTIYIEYSRLVHFFLINQRLCCVEVARPVLRRLLTILLSTVLQFDLSDSDSLDVLNIIDALFFCFIGYPPQKKISLDLDYFKKHPPANKSIQLTNSIADLSLVYSHFKPPVNLSFAIISSNVKTTTKKSSITLELQKLLSLIGESVSLLIKDRNGIAMAIKSLNLNKCLNGQSSWPIDLIDNSNTNVASGWNNSFDFSIFLTLSDHGLKSSNFEDSLKWVLLGIVALPSQYHSWWALATYLVYTFENKLDTLKEENTENISVFTRLFRSIILCYNQTIFLLPSDSSDKIFVLGDYIWFCCNMIYFSKIDLNFSSSFHSFSQKASNFVSRSIKYVLNNSRNFPDFDSQFPYIQVTSISNIHAMTDDQYLELLLEIVTFLTRENSPEKHHTLTVTLVLFELCFLLWKSLSPNILTLSNAINACTDYLKKYYRINQVSLPNEPLSENKQSLEPEIESSPSQPNDDQSTKLENSQTMTCTILVPKDDTIFHKKPHQSLALIGMLHCLSVSTYNVKFIYYIAKCLLELSDEHIQYSSFFNLIFINFITGNLSYLTNSPSDLLSKIFQTLQTKYSSGSKYLGIFSLNTRSSLFRRTWKMNNRILDGFCTFQNYVFNCLEFTIVILSKSNDVKHLTHICYYLSREKTNVYLFEQQRFRLLNTCKVLIFPLLEQFYHSLSQPSPGDTLSDSNIDTHLSCCHKIFKGSLRLKKDQKNFLKSLIINTYLYKNHIKLEDGVDPKTHVESALKYAASLESKTQQSKEK